MPSSKNIQKQKSKSYLRHTHSKKNARERGATYQATVQQLKQLRIYGQTKLFESWANVLIWGDNLRALQLLLKDPQVAGRINLVYIDPPFATNEVFRVGTHRTATISSSSDDETAYEDKLIGDEYLDFLRQRLVLIRELMSPEGSVYLHIDTKMGHYVKILMDEVFGKQNFINDITRIKSNPKNFSRKAYGNMKDVVFFYSKTKDYVWNEARVGLTDEDIDRLFPKLDYQGRRYTTNPIHAPGETKRGPTGSAWKGILPPKGRHWRYSPEELTRLDNLGLIEWSSSGNPRKIIYAIDVMARGKKLQDLWEFKDPQYPTYPTEKNMEMLKMLVATSSNPGDIVLDCFAGSGTTLVAAENLKRRWIGVDRSAAAIRICEERLKGLDGLSPFKVVGIDE